MSDYRVQTKGVSIIIVKTEISGSESSFENIYSAPRNVVASFSIGPAR
jgi:hypothetical protein